MSRCLGRFIRRPTHAPRVCRQSSLHSSASDPIGSCQARGPSAPAAGFVGPISAIALGALAALPSYFGLILRVRTTLDDSLDVVAAHGVGGTVGALLTGVFAQKALNGVADGLLFGNPAKLGIQGVAVLAAIVYSGALTFVLLKLIGAVVPLRTDAEEESTGLDVTQHGEEAYVHAQGSGTLSMQR
ncbi:MAG: hypothetical protein DMF92_09890 [Acidobacteria bacterium]|nr:MAG: hypothetical protein DMF92_09890 [Acidobacteriota bacterium]